MQPKTLAYAILAVLAVSAVAAADHASTTDASTSGIKIDPASAVMKPVSSMVFNIDARATHDGTLALAIGRHTGDGYRATLSTDALDVPGGDPTTATAADASAHATLVISVAGTEACDVAPSGYAGFEVVAV